MLAAAAFRTAEIRLIWQQNRGQGRRKASRLISVRKLDIEMQLGPEMPEDAEIVQPKVYKQRIRLGRLRRARVSTE
jgi:hypothetical protein